MTDHLDVRFSDCCGEPGIGDVALDEREAALFVQFWVGQVRPGAAREIVDADHLMVVIEQPVDDVGSDEASGSGHEYAHVTTIDGQLRRKCQHSPTNGRYHPFGCGDWLPQPNCDARGSTRSIGSFHADAPPRPEPFTAHTSTATLDDLRARLRATRWPDAPEGAGWSLGTDVDYLRELVTYWADEFDWPAQEDALNSLPRFRVAVGGLGIHFVHARAATPNALPLVLTHGWPDSFWRYSKVVPLLTDPGAHGADPAEAFDVVVPDVPGFGYSDAPVGPPIDSIAVAALWAELMSVIGYEKFGAAGGDIGSHVSRYLALDYPDRVVAVHRTDAGLFTGDPADLTKEERDWLTTVATWGATEGAYAAMHRTKPQTAAVGLNDSPAALRHGSSRNSGRGAAATATSNGASRKTRSSTTSRSTGSRRRSARRCACTTRTR